MLYDFYIVDTFLFSEPHEADLLWVKFNLEDNHVDKWIIQENEYTLQGEKKGLHANEVLKDKRFDKFRDKVHIISVSQQLMPADNRENTNFQREGWQRMLCRDYLVANYHDKPTLVLVSDVDESVDFSDFDRAQRYIEIALTHYPNQFCVGRMRYWYDYDNRCYLPDIRIPTISVEQIMANPNILAQCRHNAVNIYDAGETPIAFEYSYVFRNMADVWRKKCTYAHTNFTEECIEEALKCNHWPRTMNRGEKLGDNEYDFFEKVELTPENSPKFVRDNLTYLKTNIVSVNYQDNRCHT